MDEQDSYMSGLGQPRGQERERKGHPQGTSPVPCRKPYGTETP